MRFAPYKTTAEQVRTGHIISTPWGASQTTLEVETVTHERFVSPEGVVNRVIRFTGWELFMGEAIFNPDGTRRHRVIRGWGQLADGRVYVDGDQRNELGFRHVSNTYLTLSGRADADQLKAELDAFLAALPAA